MRGEPLFAKKGSPRAPLPKTPKGGGEPVRATQP